MKKIEVEVNIKVLKTGAEFSYGVECENKENCDLHKFLRLTGDKCEQVGAKFYIESDRKSDESARALTEAYRCTCMECVDKSSIASEIRTKSTNAIISQLQR